MGRFAELAGFNTYFFQKQEDRTIGFRDFVEYQCMALAMSNEEVDGDRSSLSDCATSKTEGGADQANYFLNAYTMKRTFLS